MRRFLVHFLVTLLVVSGLLQFNSSAALANIQVDGTNTDFTSAKEITLGETYSGTNPGEYHYFKVSLKEKGKLTIKLKNNVESSYYIWLSSLDDKYTSLLHVDSLRGVEVTDGSVKYTSRSVGLPAGIYYLNLHSRTTGKVPYEFSVNHEVMNQIEEEPNQSLETATSFDLNSIYTGYSTSFVNAFGGGTDFDFFKFTLNKPSKVRLAIKNHMEYSYGVRLLDMEHEDLTFLQSEKGVKVKDGKISHNYKEITLPAGTYYSALYGADEHMEHIPYELSIQTVLFDVSPSYWAFKEIMELNKKGIISGYANGNFEPNDNITRAQGYVMLARALKLDVNNRPNPNFSDLKSTHWAYKEIAALADEGIISKSSTISPNNKLTREDMAVALVKAYKLKGSYEKDFSDVKKNSDSYNSISALAANGITLGYADGTFKPKDPVTRTQFAVFMYRAIHLK